MNSPQYITPKGTYVQIPEDFNLKLSAWFLYPDSYSVSESWQQPNKINDGSNSKDNPDNSLERIRNWDKADNPSDQTNY